MLVTAALLSACSTGPDLSQGRAAPTTGRMASGPLSLQAVSFGDLPGWREDGVAEALPALRHSCDHIVNMPQGKMLGDCLAGNAGDWTGPCGALRGVGDDSAAARAWAEHWLAPYRVTAGGSSTGTFTGYCEAELRGSRSRTATYRYPLYARPSGWPADPAKSGQVLPTHAEIENGALNGRAQVLLWVDDLVDANILQIQGSGRVMMDDGSVVQVGYDGNNGQDWVGLGKILINHGLVGPGETSMPSIRAWLKSHPSQAPALMAENPRFIFFRMLKGEGPVGAEGVALTPGRSLAVDNKYIPLGVPIWLDTNEPSGRPLRRLVVAQDIGKGVTGPVRGDFFWGPGEDAFENAGRMKSQGSYYLLLPRQRSVPVAWDTN